MAENNLPTISPNIPEPVEETREKMPEETRKKIPRRIREKVPDERPDIDVLEWARRHIDTPEIPEIPNLLALLSVETIAAEKRPERKVPGVKKMESKPAKKPVTLKANRVAALFASLEKLADPGKKEKCRRRADAVSRNATLIARLTAPGFTDYHLKEARGMIEVRAEGSGFSYLEGEISRLRLLVEDLIHRLGDLERERRFR